MGGGWTTIAPWRRAALAAASGFRSRGSSRGRQCLLGQRQRQLRRAVAAEGERAGGGGEDGAAGVGAAHAGHGDDATGVCGACSSRETAMRWGGCRCWVCGQCGGERLQQEEAPLRVPVQAGESEGLVLREVSPDILARCPCCGVCDQDLVPERGVAGWEHAMHEAVAQRRAGVVRQLFRAGGGGAAGARPADERPAAQRAAAERRVVPAGWAPTPPAWCARAAEEADAWGRLRPDRESPWEACWEAAGWEEEERGVGLRGVRALTRDRDGRVVLSAPTQRRVGALLSPTAGEWAALMEDDGRRMACAVCGGELGTSDVGTVPAVRSDVCARRSAARVAGCGHVFCRECVALCLEIAQCVSPVRDVQGVECACPHDRCRRRRWREADERALQRHDDPQPGIMVVSSGGGCGTGSGDGGGGGGGSGVAVARWTAEWAAPDAGASTMEEERQLRSAPLPRPLLSAGERAGGGGGGGGGAGWECWHGAARGGADAMEAAVARWGGGGGGGGGGAGVAAGRGAGSGAGAGDGVAAGAGADGAGAGGGAGQGEGGAGRAHTQEAERVVAWVAARGWLVEGMARVIDSAVAGARAGAGSSGGGDGGAAAGRSAGAGAAGGGGAAVAAGADGTAADEAADAVGAGVGVPGGMGGARAEPLVGSEDGGRVCQICFEGVAVVGCWVGRHPECGLAVCRGCAQQAWRAGHRCSGGVRHGRCPQCYRYAPPEVVPPRVPVLAAAPAVPPS